MRADAQPSGDVHEQVNTYKPSSNSRACGEQVPREPQTNRSLETTDAMNAEGGRLAWWPTEVAGVEAAFKLTGFVASVRDGEAKEECGGGGAGKAGRAQGRQGPGEKAHGGAVARECAEGGAGTVGGLSGRSKKEEEKVRKCLAHA